MIINLKDTFMQKKGGLLLLLLALVNIAFAQNITGVVLDQDGLPLPGANVSVKNAKVNTLTNSKGEFNITMPAGDQNPVLVISYVGFETQEIKISEQRTVKITLREEHNSLNEIVVIGYGSVSKRDLTGSVEKADMDAISEAPVANLDEALAGRIAGVNVSFGEGTPGSESQIIIRGANSITQDNSPLYVIDGFPVEESMSNTLDPKDIASLEVLKDASATAILGARGANGVIIITTKKGTAGSPQISYSGSYGVQRLSNTTDVMDGYEFAKYQWEVRTANNVNSTYFIVGKDLNSYQGRGIDFQDHLFHDAPIQNHRVSISGGTNDSKYLVSLSNTDQEGVIINSGYGRFQGRFNLDQKIFSWLNFGLNANYSRTKKYGTAPSVTGSSGTNSLLQNMWAYRPVAGNDNVDLLSDFVDSDIDTDNNFQVNPLLTAENELRDDFLKNFRVNGYLEAKLPWDLKFRSNISYTGEDQRRDVFNNSKTREGSPIFSRIGVNGQVSYFENSGWLNENLLTYNRKINEVHHLDLLAGFTMQERSSISNSVQMQNVPNESLGMSGIDEGLFNRMAASRENWTLMSYLSRANYNYRNKYYITASFRADGSSKFP